MLLADLGADVIRVEAPHRADLVRLTPPFDGDRSTWDGVLNRSKRSISLDLKHPAAREIVFRLVGAYDIVLEQLRPGVMDRLGVGYDALSAVNPAVIYCALTAYGQTGPHKDRAGHDINMLALSGIMSHSGTVDHGPPPLGIQVADVGASYNAVLGILAAVVHRSRTGQGQLVDVSMFDTALSWNLQAAACFLGAGERPRPEDSLLNGGTFYGYYRTADDRYLSVGCLEPKFWSAFCHAIGRSDLVPAGRDSDLETQRQLRSEVAKVIATRPLADWIGLFEALDACVEPVLSVEEMSVHPQTVARESIVCVPKAGGGVQRQIAHPVRFSVTPPIYKHTGATPGEHTVEIMAQLGYRQAEIDGFANDGVFG